MILILIFSPNLQRAAKVLVGRHDFSSFRGKDCQARFVCM